MPGTPPRKSGVVIPRQPKWHGRLAAVVLWSCGSALAKTWRLNITDESGFIRSDSREPLIFAIWHNRLSVAMAMWAWGRRRQPHARLAALISASRDGGLLAKTFANFGVVPVRGSTSRRGPQAMIELVRALRQGSHVAITPDGPRGPKYKVQPGIISLAQVSGSAIVPVGARVHRKIRLRSWDNFQVPLPLTRCELVFDRPMHVARDCTEEQREEARAALERRLLEINPD